MEEVDQLIAQAATKWYAYGILFGKHKGGRDAGYADVIISVYVDKYTALQRKFVAPTLAQVMEEVKKWLVDPSYIQGAYSSILHGSAVRIDKTNETPLFS
jgi:hypothetical protein